MIVAIEIRSQPFAVRLAFFISIATAGITIAFLIMTLSARALTVMRERRRRRLIQLWRPMFLSAVAQASGDLLPVPRLRRLHWTVVLTVWSHLQESLSGEARSRLRELGRQAGFGRAARQLLRAPNTADRLLAIIALGNLGERGAWDDLEKLVRAGKPVVSAAAARALVRIDAEEGIAVVAPMLLAWSNWHPARIASILNEAGSEIAARAVTDLLAMAPPKDLPRLVRYLEVARNRAVLPVVRRTAADTDDPELLAAALHVFGVFRDPEDAAFARRSLDHPEWFVRVQAAQTLGRIGGETDEPLLQRMLGDREWWVRYRAAQALASLPGVTTEHLQRLCDTHADRYARDAIAQVLAERRIA